MTTVTLPNQTTPSRRFTEMMVLMMAVLGTGMLHIDARSITVALPNIQGALNADIGGMQWLVDIYILILASLLLIGGILGDRYGHVRIAASGAFLFTAGALFSGLAPSLPLLIGARSIQAVGGSMLIPSGLALINATVAPQRRARMLGLWVTLTTPLIAVGPTLAGWLIDSASWRAIFLINVPLGIVACFIALRYIPASRPQSPNAPLDWPGVATLIIGLSGLLFGLIEGPRLGWGDPLIIATLGGGVVGLVTFVFIESKTANPILPLRLFRHPTFSGITLMSLTYFMAFGGLLFFLALNLQQVQGYSALATGLTLLPITLTIFALSAPIGRLTDRIGPVPLLIIGPVIGTLSFILFAQLGIESNYWTSFFPPTLLLGIAMGLTIVPGTVVALAVLPNRYSGIASGVSHAVTRMGDMLAIAILGAAMVTRFHTVLTQQVARLPLDTQSQALLLAQARNLGATTPPASLSPELAQATRAAIQLAFVDSFQLVMYICAGLMMLSLLIVLLFVRDPFIEESDRGV